MNTIEVIMKVTQSLKNNDNDNQLPYNITSTSSTITSEQIDTNSNNNEYDGDNDEDEPSKINTKHPIDLLQQKGDVILQVDTVIEEHFKEITSKKKDATETKFPNKIKVLSGKKFIGNELTTYGDAIVKKKEGMIQISGFNTNSI